MEPPDPARVDENAGRPKRRISSILKTPRTSARLSDPEQAQRRVEVAKPVEKRNSRRVSFAPANDVLLFSKDLKNVSPGSSTLQVLSTSTAENVDKRFQCGITEDGTRPITGMETLLNAPLHASQQRNKENFMAGYDAQDDWRERTVMFTGDVTASMDLTRNHTQISVADALRSVLPGPNNVGHNAQEDLGEKTLMFSADDTGTMDMTHSHTIIIGNCSESDAILPDQNCDTPTCGNLDFTFSEKRKAENSVPAKNTSSSARGLNPDFANFLASISKPSGTRANPVTSNVALGATLSPQEKIDAKELFARLNMRKSGIDKEKRAPTFTSKVIEKPQSEIGKSVSGITLSTRSVVFSEDNDGMDNMIESLTGHIEGNASTDEPLQCLFPKGNASTDEPLQCLFPKGNASTDEPLQCLFPKGNASTDEPLQFLFPTPELYELSGHRSRTGVTLGQQSTKVQAHYTQSDHDDMDITKSHTVTIDSKSNGMELPSLSKTRSRLDQSLTNFTGNHTVSQVFRNADRTLCRGERTKYDTSESDDMEITRSQTVAIDTKSLHTVNPLPNIKQKSLSFMVPPNKASNVSEDDCEMDMTKALTVSIDHISNSAGSRMSANPLDGLFPQTNHKIESLPEANSDDMEMTRSQTVAINTNSLHTVNPLQNTKRKSLAFMAASNKASNVSEDDCEMDMTKALTVSIDHISNSAGSRMSAKPLNSLFPQTSHKKEASFKQTDAYSDDMEFTRSQTIVIEGRTLDAMKPSLMAGNRGPADILGPNRRLISEDDNGMDQILCQGGGTSYGTPRTEPDDMEMTRSQTVVIDTKSLHTVNPLQSTKRKSLAFTTAGGPVSLLSSNRTLFSEDDHGMEKTLCQGDGIRYNTSVSEPDDMEMTRSQTVAIDTNSFHTVNPLQSTKRKSLAFMTAGGPVSLLSSIRTLSEDDNGMDQILCQGGGTSYGTPRTEPDDMEMTRSQTVAINTNSLHTVNPLQNTKRKSLAFMAASNKASNVSEDDCEMDMTKALTVSIDHISNSVGSRMSAKPLNSLFPQTSHKKEASFKQTDAYSDDMEFTRSQTIVIEGRTLDAMKPSLIAGNRGPADILGPNRRLISEDDNGMDQILCQGGGTSYGTPRTEPDDMEMTRSQTVVIDTKSLHTVNPLQSTKRKSLAFTTAGGPVSLLSSNRTLFSEDDHGMEKTLCQGDGIRYNTSVSEPDDMEMTRSQTVAIDTNSLHTVNPLQSTKRKSLAFMTAGGPVSLLSSIRTLSEDDNGMDQILCQGGGTSYGTPRTEPDDMEMTRSQTVAINTNSLHTVNPLQNTKRKSLAFMSAAGPVDILGSNRTLLSESDDGIKMTKASATTGHVSQNVSHSSQRDQNVSRSSQRDQTMAKVATISRVNVVEEGDLSDKGCLRNDQFIMDSGDMDLTRSQTAIIDSEIPSMGHQGIPFKARKSLSSQRERTVTLREVTPPSDPSARVDVKIHLGPDSSRHKTDLSHCDDMELTRSQTVAIESDHIDVADETPFMKSGNPDNFPQANAPFEDPSRSSCSRAHSVELHVTDCRDNVLKGSTDPGGIERTIDKTFSISVLADDHEMTFTKALTMNIEQLDTAREAMISSQLPEVQFTATTSINPPHPLNSKETDDQKHPEMTHENISSSQGLESSPNKHPEVDDSSSRTAKARRTSLADLQSKLKRMSCMRNEPTEIFATDSCAEPQPVGDRDVMGITDEADNNIQSERFTEEEHPSGTAPLNLKSLISRLSMGSFMPKLPQRNKPAEPNQMESSNRKSVGERRKTYTLDMGHELSSNGLMENIEDEVLLNISEEDLSETVETSGEEIPHQGHNVEVFYEQSCPSKKRPFPEDCHEGTIMEDEKRRKQTVDSIQEMGPPSQIATCNSSITAAPSIIKTINSSCSSSTTNLRCEATFESTFQQSVFQSQLEDSNDYTDDVRKVEYESITVSEFFKLFNIDFLIHNPRQSILPAKLASDVDCQPEDILRDRHITLPKQRVYETDCQSLTEKVEGLKVRMKDQENLLKNVNRPLWEAVKTLSENEMKCFGSKLKERSNYFRRTSKVLSHEMKEGLYTNHLHTSTEEQQKLRGKIEKTDEVLKSLDDCIHELEAEIAAVEGTGQEDSEPTLKSRQQELESVNRDLADKERQKCEVDEQKSHNVDQMNRLRTETQHLEDHITMLNRLIEWKFVEKSTNSIVYTFLYQTLRLEVVFDKSDGDDASDVSERNISDITFQLSLDDEAECHARLVHKLVSQYIDGGGSWTKKYPTSLYVPKLLHDMSLVVSRCRLLGEEVHLLKKWGALRLDVLDISCADTRVHILFSSLKAFAKFELTIGVTSAYPYCLLQVHNFHSYIGNTTIHQLEEIVFSVTPAKNYLTKIVKMIHERLLC